MSRGCIGLRPIAIIQSSRSGVRTLRHDLFDCLFSRRFGPMECATPQSSCAGVCARCRKIWPGIDHHRGAAHPPRCRGLQTLPPAAMGQSRRTLRRDPDLVQLQLRVDAADHDADLQESRLRRRVLRQCASQGPGSRIVRHPAVLVGDIHWSYQRQLHRATEIAMDELGRISPRFWTCPLRRGAWAMEPSAFATMSRTWRCRARSTASSRSSTPPRIRRSPKNALVQKIGFSICCIGRSALRPYAMTSTAVWGVIQAQDSETMQSAYVVVESCCNSFSQLVRGLATW